MSVEAMRTLVLSLLVAAMMLVVLINYTALNRIASVADASPNLASASEEIFDVVADSLTEAGFAYPSENLDDPLLAQRKIIITEGMNERTAKSVVRKLLYLDSLAPGEPIDLYISTQGGWFDSAFSIIDTMEEIRSPVNTIAFGGCYSAGTLLLAAGTGRRTVKSHTLLSVHASIPEDKGPWTAGKPGRDRVEGLFKERASLPDEWFPLEGGRHYYLSPQQAVELGLADAVAGGWSGLAVEDAEDAASKGTRAASGRR